MMENLHSSSGGHPIVRVALISSIRRPFNLIHPIGPILLRAGLFVASLFITDSFIVGTGYAQGSAKTAQEDSIVERLKSEFLELKSIESNHVGFAGRPSHAWAVTDSLITVFGKDDALNFFTAQITSNKAAIRFYAVLGIAHAGGDVEAALAKIRDEDVMALEGCVAYMTRLKDELKRQIYQ